MIIIEKKSAKEQPSKTELESYVSFLHINLEEYGDKKEDIAKALDYALAKNNKPGGFILVAKDAKASIMGITVVLDTLMEQFIPEHILVYIATDTNQRGKGIGKKLIQAAIQYTKGSIALHVEPQNPAKILYEKLGFENKYLEMRLSK